MKSTNIGTWICLGIVSLGTVGCHHADPVSTQTATAVSPTPPISNTAQATLPPLVTSLSAPTIISTQTGELDLQLSPQPLATVTINPLLSDEIFPIPDAHIDPLAPTIYQNHLYVPAANHLIVFDVADPVNMKEVGRRTLGGQIIKLLVDGQYAYALRNVPNDSSYYATYATTALEILDIQDPTNPRSIHSYTSVTNYILDFGIAGHYVYFIEGRGTAHFLNWLDISNPVNPVHKGSLSQRFGYPHYFEASDNHLYFVHSQADRYQIRYEAYLEVFETAVSENLNHVASYDFTIETASEYTRVARYLAGQFNSTVYIIALDPEHIPEEGFASIVIIPEDHLYNLLVWDVSNPEEPIELTIFNDADYRMKMLTQTVGYAFLPGNCLQFYDLSTPPETVEAGCYPFAEGDSPLVLGTKDNLVYLLLRQYEYEDRQFVPLSLVVVDVSDRLRPLEVSNLPMN